MGSRYLKKIGATIGIYKNIYYILYITLYNKCAAVKIQCECNQNMLAITNPSHYYDYPTHRWAHATMV